MNFLEKDLEDIIFESFHSDSSTQKLHSRGLELMYKKPYLVKRQLKVGNYGVLDLITLERYISNNGVVDDIGTITIFELKKDIVNNDALIQALRYARGVINYLAKKSILSKHHIEIILIGKKVDLGDWVYTSLLYGSSNINVKVYEYSYSIDGIEFNLIDLVNYSLIEEGFDGI